MKKWILVIGVLLTFNARAESCTPDNQTCFECGAKCTMKLTYETDESGNQVGTLTVSGQGAMNNYSYHQDLDEYGDYYSRPWAGLAGNVQNIKIEEGITAVGANAFLSFRNLKNVELPESVLKLNPGAFQSCSSLSHINIGENISLIGHEALEATALTSLVIPQNTDLSIGAFFYQTQTDKLQTLYCTENNLSACEAAIGYRGDGAKVVTYSKTKDGRYEIGGKIYDNFENMMSGKYTPRRIYTLEDAEKVSKKTGNKFRLRYK
ncbi:MAG: leucine-rich repeat domain-containing protein [Alphaproteobacteria bacterium]|nr:leucine-rich repeat domain-containing protein [Alphaproteobacteria bacterium]